MNSIVVILKQNQLVWRFSGRLKKKSIQNPVDNNAKHFKNISPGSLNELIFERILTELKHLDLETEGNLKLEIIYCKSMI